MDSSGRQPPKERDEEKILQETHQNRLPPTSTNQKRPLAVNGSNGKATPSPHTHGVQRQSLQKSASKHSFEACLDSAQMHSSSKRPGVADRGFPSKTIVMKSSASQSLCSSSSVKPSAPRLKGQPLTYPGVHHHPSPKEHETMGRQKQVSNTTHMYKLGEKLQKPPLRGQIKESSTTPKSKDRSSSHAILPGESEKNMNPMFRPLASTYAKSGTEQSQHSRSNSHSRHPSGGTVRDGCKSHHSSNPKGRHSSESSLKAHRADTVRDRDQSQERSRHRSESGRKHCNRHNLKDREKSQVHQERPRHRSDSEVNNVKERRKSQELLQHRSRHQSESSDRHNKMYTVSDRKKLHGVPQQRQRSHSESCSNYHHIGIVKPKKSPEASRVRSTESSAILHEVSNEEDMLASKQKNTMIWLLNSTPSVEEEQLSPPKLSTRQMHDQTLSPNADYTKGSFIVVQDKAGWAKRIYSDGSSGVTSGMEPVGRSSYSSADGSGCQKRNAEGDKELHFKKKSKLHRKNSSPSASHQGGPSYGALLTMAKQNLSNGQHAQDNKIPDKVPQRIRRNSQQIGSDSEHPPSLRNTQEGLPKCDFDEEKVERLFKASLSVKPKIQFATPADKQKLIKQSSVESQASLESSVNSTNSNSVEKISLEKVGRLFNASLNVKSKTPELPKIETKVAKCPLEEAQSPERPQYTCTLVGRESSSKQSNKKPITMSFRKVHHPSKKSFGSHHHHRFREKSVKRLLLEASSRAVHIPLKRLQLKSDSIFLTDDILGRLGRSSSVIVNTARKHNLPQGKKQKGHKLKSRRRTLPLCSSSDPDTPSVSNGHRQPLQVPLRQAMSDSAALSESSVSSGVVDLFQKLSSDSSKTEQTSDSSPLGLHGRIQVTASPKLSGSISKLKQRIGKRLQAAVHGDRPGCSSSENESESTLFGSSAAEGYPFGDSEYIRFSSGVEDVIFEETVATENDERMDLEDGCDQEMASNKDALKEDPQIDTLPEPTVGEASEGNSSPASATSPKPTVFASQAEPHDAIPDQSEKDHINEECAEPKADEASKSGRNVVTNEQPLSGGDHSTKSIIGSDVCVTQTNGLDLMSDKSENTWLKVDKPVLQNSEHPSPSPSGQAKALVEQHNKEILEDTTDPELVEGCSGEALDDSESLPDVDLNAGDEEDLRDTHENSSDSFEMDFNSSMVSTDDSQPANTPTTIMKEVSQIGNVPLPGTPSKPYPFPLNDSMSPGRLSQDMAMEESTTKKKKLQFSLDKMMDIKKKTDNFAATFTRLKQDVSQGGFARQMEEQLRAGDGDHDDGSGDEIEEHQGILSKNLLKKYGVPEEQKIPIVHPGEDIFDQTKLRQAFNYDDHMASLAGCGFKPDKPSALESLMLKATPDEMVEMLRTFAVEMAYHSKPCPPAFMLWLFRLMSVHTDCNVVNKVYQTMWSILNSWPIQHPDVVPWAPSVADFTQILFNYGASFRKLLPPELVHPDFDENDIRPPNGKDESSQETARVHPSADDLTDAEKARYHGNNLMKVIKILTLALITRKTVDRFPYSEEEVCCLAVLICKASLEKYFIMKAVENDFTLCLVALFECVPETSWKSQAERLCHLLPYVAAHHHNLVYITHLMPSCTERGRYMSRQLAYMCLKKLSSDKPHQNVNGFHPELKVQDILDIVPTARPHKDTDYYELHSKIQILDLAIGNEALDKSEKESLQALNKKLKLFVSDIRDNKGFNISRSQVKDLIVRMTLRLTLMDQAIVSDQVSLCNRVLPLSKSKEENIEEHFPQSQEDGVSISSEEGEDKLDDLDDEEEVEEDHAPEAAQSTEKS